ncbi:MAG: hypothetical protein GOMPHAMPRED_007644 [Gomphillus americanus]|uniref:FAS1 domain-containing protein n=1 Tax=Gomphillus americanus TaxID=1940652 RepID=A0A8H3EY00_9LECA|nr:MAG: hypothetical protein GOMPHAMPRED_007644 [Gomphillus americanus]
MRCSLAILAIAASVAAQNSTSNTTLASVLTSNSNLSNLTSLVTSLNLVDTLSQLTNVTILAPSNAAFTKFMNSSVANTTLGDKGLLTALLTYHVLNGTINSSQIASMPTFVPTHLTNELVSNVTDGQRVEALNSSGTISFLSGLLTNSTVTQADITYNNGIIHVIDTVLEPPQDVAETAEAFNLTAIVGALTTLSLADIVDETSDLTIFAPNNDAFQAIASVLSNASTDTLKSVLTYHVIPGKVLYSPLIENGTQTTLNNSTLTLTVANGSVFVNQARVVTPNVLVANGVVHVIDSVLNPGSNATAGSNSSTAFPNATSASGVPFTSGVPTPTSVASVPSQVTAASTTGSSSSAGAAKAMATGMFGAGVLFAGALLAL